MKSKILIVGGGITGVTIAGLLQDHHEVTLIEKSSEWRTIGYAVGIWRSGLDILKKLQLPDSFWNEAWYVSNSGAIMGGKAQILSIIQARILSNKNMAESITRKELHQSLISKLKNVQTRFNSGIQNIKQSARGVEVVFEDGKEEAYDLVIGADGVHSEVRRICFGMKPLRSYDWFAWYGYVDRKHEHYSGWYALSSSKEFVLSFPISEKTNTVIFAFHRGKNADPKNVSTAGDLKRIFTNLSPYIDGYLDSIKDINSMYFSELFFVKMKKWHEGRVVLAGDSRHARSPVSGMGTTLALEDAYILADELNKNDSIDVALKKYQKRRRKRSSFVLRCIDFLESNVMRENKLHSILSDILFRLIPDKIFIYLLKKIFYSKI